VEPFAGGGIISLTALFERLVDRVVMVELDEDIASNIHLVKEKNLCYTAPNPFVLINAKHTGGV